MLMAATAAPLYAQQAAGSPAEQVLARLAAPAQAPSATAQQRAAALPALSHVPANCELAFSVCNIGDTVSKMAAAGMFGTLDDPLPEQLVNLDSFAFAASEGLSDFITQLFPIMAFGSNEIFDDASDEWSSNAKEAFAKIIESEAAKAKDAASKASIASLPKAKFRPIYAVLTAKPGKEAMMEQWFGISVNNLQENVAHASEQGLEAVETNGFKGISFRLPEKGAQPSKYDNEFEKALKAEMAKRTFYVLLKMDGNALVGVICENPDEINLPKKPEESILGTNKLAGCDAHLNVPILTTSYASPKFSSAYTECQLAPYRAAVQTTVNIFNALAKDGDADKQAFTAAAKGLDNLSQLLFSKLAPSLTQAEFHQIWLENGSLESEWKLPANKDVSYIPGKLRLAGMAQNPSTILYAENTGADCKAAISWNEVIDAAADISNGFIRTLKDGQQAQAGMGIIASFIPDAKNAISAAVTIHEGLGGNSAFIIDSAGSIPSILGGKPGNTTAMPRMALYSGVKDRSKIGNGWDQLLSVAGNVAARMGADPSAVQMLPIVPKETGDTSSYSVAMPWFTKDMVPNVTLNDGHFAMGTSSELNEQLVNSATGSAPFTGAVCILKFKPLADTMDGIASMLREKADAAKSADEKEQAIIAEEDGEEEDYEEPDYSDYYAFEEPSPEEKAADKAETFASVAKWFAKHADSLYATHTIDKDTQTMRISITPKK